jgi:hypothetical protein
MEDQGWQIPPAVFKFGRRILADDQGSRLARKVTGDAGRNDRGPPNGPRIDDGFASVLGPFTEPRPARYG